MNYLELYPGDYMRDTKHLSLSEHGAFMLLLMAYYSTEKPLPADLPSLYRIAGALTAPEQKAVRSVADPFFPVGEDGLRHNARADREIAKAQRRIETAKSNGKKGGRPKKDKESENPPGFDPDTHRKPDGKAHHTPHAIHRNLTTTLSGRSQSPEPPEPDREAGGTLAVDLRKAAIAAGIPPDRIRHNDAIWTEAVDAGVTPGLIHDAVTEYGKRKGIAYALRTAIGRANDATARQAQGPPAKKPPSATLNAMNTLLAGTSYAPDLAQRHDPNGALEAPPATPRRLPAR